MNFSHFTVGRMFLCLGILTSWAES